MYTFDEIYFEQCVEQIIFLISFNALYKEFTIFRITAVERLCKICLGVNFLILPLWIFDGVNINYNIIGRVIAVTGVCGISWFLIS